MSVFGQGLTLSGIGILITFSALGILILLILALKILFPVRGDDQETAHPPDDRVPVKAIDREELRKKAAAAGVAILLEKRLFKGMRGLGSELERPVSNWWQKGLDRNQAKD